MKVKINNTWYSSDNKIMLVLSEDEKELISNGGDRIALFPENSDLSVQERYEWMEGDLPDLCLYFVTDNLHATGLIALRDFSFEDGKLNLTLADTLQFPAASCLVYIWDRREDDNGERLNVTHCYRTNGNVVASSIDGVATVQFEVKEA